MKSNDLHFSIRLSNKQQLQSNVSLPAPSSFADSYEDVDLVMGGNARGRGAKG